MCIILWDSRPWQKGGSDPPQPLSLAVKGVSNYTPTFVRQMIVQVVGEFGVTGEDSNMLVANVWARESAGLTSGFISTVRVPAKDNESSEEQTTRLFRALNAVEKLLETLADFIQLLIRHK